MVQTNAMAIKATEANGIIDILEAAASGAIGASEKFFLAAYQLRLAAGRTPQSEDVHFKEIFDRYWLWAMSRK